jgi:hypothetical protein
MTKKNRFATESMDKLWAEQFAFWRDHIDIAIEEILYPIK